ncbi:MAG TPA: DsbA family oxidoreductase [Ktedonobacterales bacterium]|jgi:predicted DsbA family dithiol-disulfide isomerase|nr:DsbA family oxidoreductase [Ktedonobacterales bacterium]
MNVEIWSDVVCPWCYIGKRRFEKALAQFAHRDAVNVRFRSFELDPHAPETYPGTLNEMLAAKMGMTPQRAAQMNARVAGLAAEEGLDYHLDQARPGNTFKAHRLLHLARQQGIQEQVKERLMRAYFTEGQPIGETGTLVEIAADAGLDADAARAALAEDDFSDEVRADEERAAAFGISGVPFVVIDERYGVSGAQPTEVFLNALQTAWNAAQPLTIVSGDTASDDAAGVCEDDTCAI